MSLLEEGRFEKIKWVNSISAAGLLLAGGGEKSAGDPGTGMEEGFAGRTGFGHTPVINEQDLVRDNLEDGKIVSDKED